MSHRHTFRASWPLAAALLASGCNDPPPPPLRPELLLDIADPLITAQVGDVTLRLRVDLDRRDTIEIGPAAAARLDLPFERAPDAEVGRVRVAERVAPAQVVIDGVTAAYTLSAFDRDCCAGADGAIGPDLLPYARVRFVRRGAVIAGEARRLPLARSEEGGLAVAQPTASGTVFVRFSLGYPGTIATASAGAMLARAYGGRLAGTDFYVSPAFGVPRPARTIAFDRPAMLAGFAILELPVRTADFGGGLALPREPAQAGEILVRRRGAPPQAAWPSVLIGRERLDWCSDILFERAPLALTLRCDRAMAG
jgi:hypothetical protein